MRDLNKFLKPNEYFNFENNEVRNKAFEITAELNSNKEKAIALFYWVRDEIKYNMMLYLPECKENFKASNILRIGEGFCVSKAMLLTTFSRAIGIPARIHLADIINHKVPQKTIDFMGTNVFYYHGYSEIYLNDKWIKLTPAFDKNTAIKNGFLPMCEFDGINDSVFPAYGLDDKPFVEYIKDRGIYELLPLDDIATTFKEKYGLKFSSDS
jgi:transglutaminase-like putative cysteine protease